MVLDAGAFRVYEDPVGHPFCVYPGVEGSRGVLWRIVIDCFSPRSLAAFYRAVLGMPNVIEDSLERVVVAGREPDGPLLAFQCAPIYVAPRWPDPAFPQQIHLDPKFDDRASVQDLAERLGAVPLPPQGGSCRCMPTLLATPSAWACRRIGRSKGRLGTAAVLSLCWLSTGEATA